MTEERRPGGEPDRGRVDPGRPEDDRRGGVGERPDDAGRGPEGEGWVRRFVAAPPRLQETVALYEELGLEVRLERPGPEELGGECEGCALATELFRVVYTRGPR